MNRTTFADCRPYTVKQFKRWMSELRRGRIILHTTTDSFSSPTGWFTWWLNNVYTELW